MSKRAMTGKDAPKERPKKPLTFYFQFRMTRLKELEGQSNRGDTIKEEWDNMSKEVKEAENAKFKKEIDKYNTVVAEWKKAHPNDEERSKPKKKKGGDDDDEEEEVKPKGKGDKSQGAPKATRGPKKEEEVKEEKGKSKGKKEERGESKKPKK
jgi:hypothetical protein